MLLERTEDCDVLVVGSGIAGISAALSAAEAGRRVILACYGKLFSGSSFYPGTWGLGLIGPEDKADEEDLAASIEQVGCGMADPEMVRTFVSGISPAVDRLRSMGVKLRRAGHGGEKEYIPCFDHKHRDWNGIEFDSAGEIFLRRLTELKVKVLPGCQLLELIKADGSDRVCGAVFSRQDQILFLSCGALVLATGGYGSIFRYHLCTEDITGMGQYLALQAGCRLVNMEFMQMMPGYISPAYKTIFNEKTFRFTDMRRGDGSELLSSEEKEQLILRSTHGPFTSRLESRTIDFALFRAFMEDERGVSVSYTDAMRRNTPEFVKVYFDWLKEARGITMEDTVHIGIFAHAANGGIKTAPDTSAGVDGLFAAGEVTGGMHGADRIGGLSTANGLVFGGKAGLSAAEASEEAAGREVCRPKKCHFEARIWDKDSCREARKMLQDTMTRNAMILRDESGLSSALDQVYSLKERMAAETVPLNHVTSETVKAAAQMRLLQGQLGTAESILKAALLRKESRGAHCRTDYPAENPAMDSPVLIAQEKDEIQAAFSRIKFDRDI
ncbi:MAG: FAD-binding protein [Lachnospiraceae bacterium]|nr:FAD-binding protein [Lachnospiraceae bacterium]